MGISRISKIRKSNKNGEIFGKPERTSNNNNDECTSVIDEANDICQNNRSSDEDGNKGLIQKHMYSGIITHTGQCYRTLSPCKWTLISVCLFLLKLCIFCIITLEVNYMKNEFAFSGTGFNVKHINIPCDDVSLSYDEDEDTFDVTRPGFKHFFDETGRSVCCFEDLTSVIEKATERESRIRLAKGLAVPRYLNCGNVEKAPASGDWTAYFTRLSRHPVHKDRGNDHLLQWDNGKTHSYIGAGITYHNGKIRVNVTRDYFVYAFVTSHQGIVTEGRNHPGSCLFTMWVFKGPAKYDGEFERIQLKSTQMLHKAASGITTSYVGSHVHLYSNEEIYVKVTDFTRLVHTSSGNGFGIFPLL